jgi:hypothetical protein
MDITAWNVVFSLLGAAAGGALGAAAGAAAGLRARLGDWKGAVFVPVVAVMAAAIVVACSQLWSVAPAVDHAARLLCEAHYQEHPPEGISGRPLAEAAQAYCSEEERLRPWRDELYRLQREGRPSGSASPAGAQGGRASDQTAR